jgi:hypothetical protein
MTKRSVKVTLYIVFIVFFGTSLSFFIITKSHTYKKNCNFKSASDELKNTSLSPGDSSFRLALKIVTEFEYRKTNSSAFVGIPKNILVQQLRERLSNPASLSQGSGGRNLCGPASVAWCQLNYDPVGYVKTIIDLYLTGRSVCGDQIIKTNSIIRSTGMKDEQYVSDYKNSRLFAVDYILLSALRYTENDGISSFFTFHTQSNLPFVNGTFPNEIEDLLDMVGLETICGCFYRHNGLTPKNSTFTTDDLSIIEDALRQNYFVILFIDFDNFNGKSASWFNSNFGNHFIVAHNFTCYKDQAFSIKYWEFANASKYTDRYTITDFNKNIKGYWIVGRKIY